MSTWLSKVSAPAHVAPHRRARRLRGRRLFTAALAVLLPVALLSAVPQGVAAVPTKPAPKAHPAKTRPVTGPKVHLRSSTHGLTATLHASTTARAGDTWWACFGDRACTAAKPSAHGTVRTTGQLPPISHTYKKSGTYPASLTVVHVAISRTASVLVTVNGLDPTAVLTSQKKTGTGSLPVTFDASASVVSRGDTWAFCYGDAKCTRKHPDAKGRITGATPAVALPTSAAHVYSPGNYTATLWITSGPTTTSATAAIAVAPAVAAPDATCSVSGAIRTCDLYAKANGSVAFGPQTIPFWGFTLSDAVTPRLGGPTLIASEGEQLAFTVHNELPTQAGAVSITVPSLAGAPDLTGVPPGSSGDSSRFTLTRPGTYVYEAGITSGGARQVAMGLSGVLVVRPSLPTAADSQHCAYDGATSTDCVAMKDALNYYDDEKVVAVNELDAAFNADPFGSDTGNYHPTNYFLDGIAYDPAKPAVDPSASGFDPTADNVRFDAAPGDSVLVRYADLGLREHSLNLGNLLQSETARDGFPLPYAAGEDTEFLNAGQTADAFVTIPPDAVTGTRYPLYDAGFHFNNGTAGGIGGIYTYFNVVNGATAGAVGPVGTAATAEPMFDPSAPNVDNGEWPTLDVNASFTAQQPGATVSSLAWAIDGVPGPSGGWQPVRRDAATTGPGERVVPLLHLAHPADGAVRHRTGPHLR